MMHTMTKRQAYGWIMIVQTGHVIIVSIDRQSIGKIVNVSKWPKSLKKAGRMRGMMFDNENIYNHKLYKNSTPSTAMCEGTLRKKSTFFEKTVKFEFTFFCKCFYLLNSNKNNWIHICYYQTLKVII